MTVLGKILVFVNLVFSVVVGGLVVVVFTARTNYADALAKSEKERKLDQGAAAALVAENKNIKAEYQKEIDALKGQVGKLQKDLDAQLAVNKNQGASLQNEAIAANTIANLKQQLVITQQRSKEDIEAMAKRLETAQADNVRLVKDNSKLTDESLQSQIREKTALDALTRLEKLYQEVSRQLARGTTGGGAVGSTPNNLLSKNPPGEKVDGQVVQTSGELLKLSIGSDSGLKENHTLELFRLSPKPLYLGTVRIRSLEPKAAVAVPVGKLAHPVQVGDTVSSRLGS